MIVALRARGISVKYDNRDTHKPGFKFNEYELKGVPVRIAIGPRTLRMVPLNLPAGIPWQKKTVAADEVVERIEALMVEIQETIY